MAIINKSTFEIYTGTNMEGNPDDYFECDDLIAPIIQVLNLKRYKTLFCCAGHPYCDDIEFRAFSISNPMTNFPGAYYSKEIERSELDEEEMAMLESEDTKVYQIKCKQFVSLETYIVFENNCLPGVLPDGWEPDENSMFKSFENRYASVFDFFHDQLECMRNLKEWADELPVVKK